MENMDKRNNGVLTEYYHIQRMYSHTARYRLKRRSYEVLKAIKRYSSGTQLSVLDIGTADGLMLETLTNELDLTLSVGIDISPELLKFANTERIFFIQSDGGNLPLKDDLFDVVVACAVIEHVPNAAGMINECHRVLKRGGVVIITTPDPFFEHMGRIIGDLKEGHDRTFGLTELRFLLTSNGFEILHLEKFMLSPIGFPFELGLEKLMKTIGFDFMSNQIAIAKK